MGFASAYLEDKSLYKSLIPEEPDAETGIIIVIPAFNEPDICNTLKSIWLCERPACGIEIIIILNSPAFSTAEQKIQNNNSLKEIESWKNDHTDQSFQLFCIDTGHHINKDWGVGMARKAGMDEAARRFDEINKPYGVIASLDADCEVSPDYLNSLYKDFLMVKQHEACSIYFEHPLEGELKNDIYKAITIYELHLRYYYQALKGTGFPEVYHTVGSSMAIKAGRYISSGGMNRRQGGEDFYFIQKLIPAGGFFYLTSTIIKPSPRASERVPFGTGPVINEMLSASKIKYLTYHPDSFIGLERLFHNIPSLFKGGEDKRKELLESLPRAVKEFLSDSDWISRLDEIQANTSSIESFSKRFLNWFNMFRIVKYLNYAHAAGYYNKIPVYDAAMILVKSMGYTDITGSESDLLHYFRRLER